MAVNVKVGASHFLRLDIDSIPEDTHQTARDALRFNALHVSVSETSFSYEWESLRIGVSSDNKSKSMNPESSG